MTRRVIPGQKPAASASSNALDTPHSNSPTSGHGSETFPSNVPLFVALADDIAAHVDQDGTSLQSRPGRAESRKSPPPAVYYRDRPETAPGAFFRRQ